MQIVSWQLDGRDGRSEAGGRADRMTAQNAGHWRNRKARQTETGVAPTGATLIYSLGNIAKLTIEAENAVSYQQRQCYSPHSPCGADNSASNGVVR